jgi:DNA primase
MIPEKDSDTLALLNEKLNIFEVVSEFITLNRNGRGYSACCPFHEEKTPSFSVSVEKNMFNCFGCHKGGGPVQFYQYIKGITLTQAIKELSPRIGIKVEERVYSRVSKFKAMYKEVRDYFHFQLKNSPISTTAMLYLNDRNIKSDIINRYKIGYSGEDDKIMDFLKDRGYTINDLKESGLFTSGDKLTFLFKNRIIFPIMDRNNDTVSFSSRTILKDVKEAKYVHASSHTINTGDKLFYNLDQAMLSIIRQKEVILVEGFFDVYAFISQGIENVLCCLGTQLSKRHLDVLKGMAPKIILCFDGDKAGQTSMIKAFPLCLQEKFQVSIASIPHDMDPDEYCRNPKNQLIDLINQASNPYEFTYNYYKLHCDILDPNSVLTLEINLNNAFKGAPKPIMDYYSTLCASEFGINLSSSKPQVPIEKETIEDYPSYEEGETYIPSDEEVNQVDYPKENVVIHEDNSDQLKIINPKILGFEINVLALIVLNPLEYEEFEDCFELGSEIHRFYKNLEDIGDLGNLFGYIKHKSRLSDDIICEVEKLINNTKYDILYYNYKEKKEVFKLNLLKKKMITELAVCSDDIIKEKIQKELLAINKKIKRLDAKGDTNGKRKN